MEIFKNLNKASAKVVNDGKPKKICMLASGGDAPGMNACMEAIFNYATRFGWEVWVSISGYNGLLNGNVVRATREKCTNISHMAGCVYKCGRSKEFYTEQGTIKVGNAIKQHGFDALIVLGGNGSLMGLERLVKLTGINAIGIPCTVDNDCHYTNNAIGYASAVEAIVRYIDQIKPTMLTCDRHFMIEVMGKGCSNLATMVGVAGFANLIDRSEQRLSVQQIADTFNHQTKRGNTSCMAIIEEYREDANNLVKAVQEASGPEVRFERAYYYQRGTNPAARDRFLAATYGVLAVDLIRAGKFGVAIGRLNDKYITPTLREANSAKSTFDPAVYSLIDKISNW